MLIRKKELNKVWKKYPFARVKVLSHMYGECWVNCPLSQADINQIGIYKILEIDKEGLLLKNDEKESS